MTSPYRVDHIDGPEDDPPVGGCGCDWEGTYSQVADIEECSLTPGDPSPAGRCPECGGLVYIERPSRPIPNTNEITTFMHCTKCIQEMPAGQSPREFTSYEVGFTKLGVQVWCKRHECNVAHIDFEGQQHPANLTTPKGTNAPN